MKSPLYPVYSQAGDRQTTLGFAGQSAGLCNTIHENNTGTGPSNNNNNMVSAAVNTMFLIVLQVSELCLTSVNEEGKVVSH